MPAESALLRLSGPQAKQVARRAGLPQVDDGWSWQGGEWSLLFPASGDLGEPAPRRAGSCPCRVGFFPAGRSYTGYDLLEITIPGSSDLVDLALAQLHQAGAEPAGPGAFSRQALATGRLTLDQAEAVLAVVTAPDAAAAQQAIHRLQGALGSEFEPLRQQLLHLRALIEAGLDFVEELDVEAYDHAQAQSLLQECRATIGRWRRAADSLGQLPEVLLVGPANAGKSALFAALSGAEAIVSPIAGTTRDWLDALWTLPSGRQVRFGRHRGLVRSC